MDSPAAPAPEPSPAEAPPADPPPEPPPAGPPGERWYHELAGYAAALLFTVGVLVGGLRLDKADFAAPFTYDYDALLILPFVKSTVETGTHWHNDRLGAPGVQELHDFPVVDHFHLAVIWLLGRAFPDPVVVFNLFHLLTYPLTTLVALFVLRRFGLSVPAAACGAVLYAFQPYHYLRGQLHYFLAAYYLVPLALMLVLWVCRGRLPFFRKQPDGRYAFRPWTWDTAAAVVIGVATASAGAYYAYFACGFLVVAGVYGWVETKTWRAAASAGLLVLTIFLAGVANHGPTFPYQAENGRNTRPHVRNAEDSERYGMKIAQLVLPVAGHNPVGLGDTIVFDPAAMRSRYQAPGFKELNETDWDPLGLVGALGYLFLLFLLFVPARLGWPLRPLAALTGFGTLLGTVGGFGAVFNYTVSAQVRCYNRVSIYLAFLALFAACWVLDKGLARAADHAARWVARRRAGLRAAIDRRFAGSPRAARAAAHLGAGLLFGLTVGWAGRLRWGAFTAVTLFGVWDQTNDRWFPDARIKAPGFVAVDEARDETARVYEQDRAFFERVEALYPEDQYPDPPLIFNYPHLEYPEAQPYQEAGRSGEKIESYDQVLGYLHTKRLRWSFGAMKGREWDTWAREVSGGRVPTRQFLERLVFAGFDGLLVDSRGLSDRHWHEMYTDIRGAIGDYREFYAGPGRHLYFFDLSQWRRDLKAAYGAAKFEEYARAEREQPLALWLKGFTSYEPVGYENRKHWGTPAAHLQLVNRADRPVTVDLKMLFRTAYKGPARLRVYCDLPKLVPAPDWDHPAQKPWDDTLTFGPDPGTPYAVRVTLPPGRHTVRLDLTPLIGVLPTDSRDEMYTVNDFEMKPVP